MKTIKEYITKQALPITIVMSLIIITLLLYIIYPLAAAPIILLALLFGAVVYRTKQLEEQQRWIRQQEIENTYLYMAEQVYEMLTEFSFLGFVLSSVDALLYPKDFYKEVKPGVFLFRFKCLIREPLEKDTDEIVQMFNRQLDSNPLYTGLYIFRIIQENGFVSVVATYRNAVTENFIKDHEHRIRLRKQMHPTDIKDKEF